MAARTWLTPSATYRTTRRNVDKITVISARLGGVQLPLLAWPTTVLTNWVITMINQAESGARIPCDYRLLTASKRESEIS